MPRCFCCGQEFPRLFLPPMKLGIREAAILDLVFAYQDGGVKLKDIIYYYYKDKGPLNASRKIRDSVCSLRKKLKVHGYTIHSFYSPRFNEGVVYILGRMS